MTLFLLISSKPVDLSKVETKIDDKKVIKQSFKEPVDD